MIEVERSQCAILPLVLKGKWFDMIASGEKREEYRARDVWCKRISNWLRRFNETPQIEHLVVAFQRGYRKPSMWFEVSWVGTEHVDRARHPEWGEPDNSHFVIVLGGRVTIGSTTQKSTKRRRDGEALSPIPAG